MNRAIAKGKYEHTDTSVIRNVEVRNLTFKNEERKGRDGTRQGIVNVGIIRNYDVEGSDKREEGSRLPVHKLRVNENLNCKEKNKLLELISK